jgi:indolepyruvate ferredoxin oxidoreductase
MAVETNARPHLLSVSLDDKYTARTGRIYLSGIQALVRLPIVQKWRDEAAGLKTAGFISGYRGSPLGGIDEALWRAAKLLTTNDIRFQPGINEDLALTSVWGTQQLNLIGTSPYDGVFGLWYAKGPGVDRSIDVMKHANHSGTSPHGGVLLVAGDDHAAYSSTVPHQSDHVFAAAMVPVLYPANVAEYLELGLHGWAMSRFSGCFVGFKALADTVESSTTIDADPFAVQTQLPASFALPDGGMNARLSNEPLGATARGVEALMQDYKIYAALAYCRENRLNRTTVSTGTDRLGIVGSGKSYMDVLEALEELGLDEKALNAIGVRLFKVSMPWPLEPDSVRQFAIGLEEILVVEEKRQIVEYQLKEQLYNWREDARPRVVGKFDEKGEWVHPRGDWLLTSKADFSVAQIARVIASRIAKFHSSEIIQSRLRFLESKDLALKRATNVPPRPAYYCSGCPHNTSTRVPEGSIALAGIGCHIMAASIFPDQNKTTTHMGGEGAPWIGQAPFSDRKHVFANLGDGTYFHSGYLAIRAAQAAGVNITYKILFNDAVAMTGGQPVDGKISVPMIANQVAAEGVQRIAIVSEDPNRYNHGVSIPGSTTIHPRTELEAVQLELREHPGVSVLIYDQTCAAEKRRRRKKGEYPDEPKRLFINEAVCEGCGDCGVQSNCTSILPLETPLGRKRMIDQSSCNKDYSCAKGYCPSFVTVLGGTVKALKSAHTRDLPAHSPIPEPALPVAERPFNILITGIGGTGVITIGALMGMAAHLEGKSVSVMDMTGMSQKNGAVMSHVRIAETQDSIRAQRIATGEADLILGCDLLTAGSPEAVSKMRPGRTTAVVNEHQQPPGSFTKDPDWEYPSDQLHKVLTDSTIGRVEFLDATKHAKRLMGDAIAANLFMLGFAYQRGRIPLGANAIERAIELNGVAISFNQRAFYWGRLAAHNRELVEREANPAESVVVNMPESTEKLIRTRYATLIDYQDKAYADEYLSFIETVRRAETPLGAGNRLTRAVAEGLYRLMAYKDEYEVSRLLSAPSFAKKLASEFEGQFRIRANLAPPIFARKDSAGNPVKSEYGPWIWSVLRVIARMKRLRGTRIDPFGWTHERRLEASLPAKYRQLISERLPQLSEANLEAAVRTAKIASTIRGYGHVKRRSIDHALDQWATLVQEPDRNDLPARMASAGA